LSSKARGIFFSLLIKYNLIANQDKRVELLPQRDK